MMKLKSEDRSSVDQGSRRSRFKRIPAAITQQHGHGSEKNILLLRKAD